MPRDISTGFRDQIEGSQTTETIVIFATLEHRELEVPICVNSDIVDYFDNDAQRFYGTALTLSLLTDDDQPPRAQCSIENVDERIGDAVLALSDSPTIKIEIMVKSDFDDAVPRNPLATLEPEYSAPFLKLRNVKCDVLQLTGDLMGYDTTSEPHPAIRSTQDKLPGLYR